MISPWTLIRQSIATMKSADVVNMVRQNLPF